MLHAHTNIHTHVHTHTHTRTFIRKYMYLDNMREHFERPTAYQQPSDDATHILLAACTDRQTDTHSGFICMLASLNAFM